MTFRCEHTHVSSTFSVWHFYGRYCCCCCCCRLCPMCFSIYHPSYIDLNLTIFLIGFRNCKMLPLKINLRFLAIGFSPNSANVTFTQIETLITKWHDINAMLWFHIIWLLVSFFISINNWRILITEKESNEIAFMRFNTWFFCQLHREWAKI